ncbi:hypothetical protein FT641_17850 [Bacillus paranthracis]|uniref:hypothetical protein n=1 Tax=Bacillus paranthracis TaxID=2026186 RepID=UPI00187AC042|nr:hypothetical protein [Bacillus paranthracis]MBE7114575.1 hypothetical protein [Bacillus paranthracis]MBE7154551.1 hypothetical protein [Bacillus paranthracis]
MLGKKKTEKLIQKLMEDTKKMFYTVDMTDKYKVKDEEFKLYQKYVVAKGLDEDLFEASFSGILAVLTEGLTVEDIEKM